jgi:hypothetical protein
LLANTLDNRRNCRLIHMLDPVTPLSDAGLDDARDFLVRRLPWDLTRPRFIDFQREHIEEITLGDPLFPSHLRHVSLDALGSDDSALLRRTLTCLAIVGQPVDVAAIESLLAHSDPAVAKDAKTAIFEIEHGI